jgi:hypothetical protein
LKESNQVLKQSSHKLVLNNKEISSKSSLDPIKLPKTPNNKIGKTIDKIKIKVYFNPYIRKMKIKI